MDRRLLVLALSLILLTMTAEVAVGLFASSLALLADAGHMLTDATALGLAVLAAWAAAKPPRGRWTYGFSRAEILAAQTNGIILVLLAIWITYEAARRLIDPPEVDAVLVGWVALVGIVVSAAVVGLLHGGQRTSLNVRGAYLHILTDVAAFAGTGVAALLIVLTGWDRFDALASLAVAVLLVWASYGLLKESTRIFLEGAPPSAPPTDVGRAIAAQAGVVETHDLHVWTVTSGFQALSAHVMVEPGADCHLIRLELDRMLRDRFSIEHTTLQVDHVGVDRGLEIRPSSEIGESDQRVRPRARPGREP